MALKTYKYNDKTKLTEHFGVWEWKCKCGKNHDIKIDDRLPLLLEELRTELEASSGNIYSGYRCVDHDKKVGGSGSTNRSHGGYAVDIYFKDKNGKRIPSSKVAILLEDKKHKYGIGYRCGGSSDSSGNIHIDVKNRKWYGDESKNNNQSISSFKAPSDGKTGHKNYLDYIYKATKMYVNASVLNVRNEPNTNGKVVNGMKYGSSINVYYIEKEWAKVGVAQWVSAKYLQKDIPTKEETKKEEPKIEVEINKPHTEEERKELVEKNNPILNIVEAIINLLKRLFKNG